MTHSLRVLQIAPVFGSVGGVENYIARLADLLESEGHITRILADDLIPGSASKADVVSVPGLAAVLAANPREALTLTLTLAEEFAPDVVLIHQAIPTVVRALSERYTTAAFVHSFLCSGSKLFRRSDHVCTHRIGARCLLDWYLGPCGPVRSPATALASVRESLRSVQALRYPKTILVGSPFMKRYLVDEGIESSRITILSDIGVNSQPATPSRERSGSPNLLFVGRAVYNKGVQYAMRATAQLGEPYNLTVVGDGYYLPQLKSLTEGLGIGDRLRFTGFLHGEDLEAEYERAGVVVVSSLLPEPAGLVVPEARSRGIPVVAFDVGGLADWTATYDRIYLAEHASVDSLAARIQDAVAGRAADSRPSASEPTSTILEALKQLACSKRRNLS